MRHETKFTIAIRPLQPTMRMVKISAVAHADTSQVSFYTSAVVSGAVEEYVSLQIDWDADSRPQYGFARIDDAIKYGWVPADDAAAKADDAGDAPEILDEVNAPTATA